MKTYSFLTKTALLTGIFSLLFSCVPTMNRVMKKAETARVQGEKALLSQQEQTLAKAARLSAEQMKQLRDRFSPDPNFYALANQAVQEAQKSLQSLESGDFSSAQSSWNALQKNCIQCHKQYGGPE